MLALLLLGTALGAPGEPAPEAPPAAPPAPETPPLGLPESEQPPAEAGEGPRPPRDPRARPEGAGEVGQERRLGVGLALGFPPSGTAKLFVDARNGLALHVGPTLAISGLHIRLQFEQAVRSLRRWEVGELLLTWHLGVAVELVFGQQAVTSGVRFGVHGGIGVELRVVPAPVAVFGEIAPVIYPFDLAAAVQGGSPFVPVQGILTVGVRWYF